MGHPTIACPVNDRAAELLNGEIFYTLTEAQVLIERRRRYYNVGRTQDGADSRRRVLTLTPAGRATLAKVDRHVKARQLQLLEGLTPAEQAQFFELLLRVLKNARHLMADEERAPEPREGRDDSVSLP